MTKQFNSLLSTGFTHKGINSLPFQGKEAAKGFTLVELIVVITIIAILGTIAFISLQGYSANARDSTRISDLSAMKTSLELFHLDAGKYPNTTTGFEVTYSGAIVWTQGTFGEITTNNVDKLDKIPKDPLTGKEYTYSVTKTKQEYQLAGLTESSEITLNNSVLLNQANAGDTIATAIVTGNYNGQTLKTETGATGEICEILSIPSIISAEGAEETNLINILTNENLVYNGYNNLPSNYKGSKYKTTEGFEFKSNQLIVYSDNKECKPLYEENPTARIELIKNLQTAYSGTTIENSDNISGLVALDIYDLAAVTLLSATLVNNNLGGKILINNNIVTHNNCLPGTIRGEAYTGITYSYNEFNQSETIIGTGSEFIPNGIKNYIGDVYCNNGITSIDNEVENIICESSYNWNGNSCVVVNTIANLSLGSIIIDSNFWEYKTGINYTGVGEIKPVEWIIVGKNHYAQDTVLLLSKDIIGRYFYSNIQGGRPWYESENTLRPFLQGTFLNHLSSNFINNIQNVSIITAGTTSSNQSIFILSLQEINATLLNSADNCGTGISYINESIRITNSFPETNWYWTRTPHLTLTSFGSRIINTTDGTTQGVYDNNDIIGIRPALNLKSTTKVVNIEGNKYMISY